MKKIKNKYIRLTEQQLNNIIKECVKKEMTLLNEYAIKRKEFKFNVWNLLEQIITNWCLVHYCALTNTDVNQCKNHWKQELSAYLTKIARTDIKGNNSTESRFKAVTEVFEENDLINNPSLVKDLITTKFVKENIPIDDEMFDKVVNDCVESLEVIALAIANKVTRDYIETI